MLHASYAISVTWSQKHVFVLVVRSLLPSTEGTQYTNSTIPEKVMIMVSKHVYALIIRYWL